MFIGLCSVNGRVHHFAIYKKGNYYEFLTDEQFPSIESMIAYYSKTGFTTKKKMPVKLAHQLIPDM